MPGDRSNNKDARAVSKDLIESDVKFLAACLSEIRDSLNSIGSVTLGKLAMYEYMFWTRPDDYRFYEDERDLLKQPLIILRKSIYAGLGTFFLLRSARSSLLKGIYQVYFTKQKAAPEPYIAGLETAAEKNWESYLEKRSREHRQTLIARVFQIKNPYLAKLVSSLYVTKKQTTLALDVTLGVMAFNAVGMAQVLSSLELWRPLSQAPLQPGHSVVHELGCPILQKTAQELQQKYGLNLASDKLRVYADRDRKMQSSHQQPKDPENLIRTAHTLYVNCQLRSKYYERLAAAPGTPVPYPGIKGRDWL